VGTKWTGTFLSQWQQDDGCGSLRKVSFSAGPPRLLFEFEYAQSSRREGNYDVSPDGQRFLMITSEAKKAPTELHLIVNWFEELKRRVHGRNTR
jgi:hypothetical protein